jgi:Transposase IS116/IS110/IS902 family
MATPKVRAYGAVPRTLEALIAGESDPARLAALANRLVKAAPEKLREALRGRVTPQHRFLRRLHLRQIEALEAAVGDIDREVEAGLGPFRAAVRLLSSIPGVGTLSAEVVVAEIGPGMRRFPTAGHLLSWAGLCPPAQRRERGQAPLHPPAQGGAVAEDRPRAVRLGGQPQEGELPAGAVPAPARPPRPEEGDLRRRRLHPDRGLPHAPRRHLLPGPRARPLRPPGRERQDGAPRRAAHRPRIHRPAASTRAGFLLSRWP